MVFSPQQDRNLPTLVRFVMRNIEDSTRLLRAADMCSRDCVLRNLRRSQTLQQELSRKTGRLQFKLQEITQGLGSPCSLSPTSSSSSEFGYTNREKDSSDREKKPHKFREYYSCLSVDFLTKRLQEVRQKMESVKKVNHFLQNSGDSSFDKNQLLSFMRQR